MARAHEAPEVVAPLICFLMKSMTIFKCEILIRRVICRIIVCPQYRIITKEIIKKTIKHVRQIVEEIIPKLKLLTRPTSRVKKCSYFRTLYLPVMHMFYLILRRYPPRLNITRTVPSDNYYT